MAEAIDLLFVDCEQAILTGPSSSGDGVIEGAALAVSAGKIVDVGRTEDLTSRYRPSQTISGRGRILTPGFVDSHSHIVFGGDRSTEFTQRCAGASYEEISAAGGGIRSTVRATRTASEDELYDQALDRALRMLSLGTTTLETKSGYGLDLETELRILRVIDRLDRDLPMRIVATFMGAHEVPDEYRGDREGYLSLVIDQVLPAVREQGIARFCDVFCEERVFSPEESVRVLEAGKLSGLIPKVHADELASSGGSRVAAEVGAISADHLMMIDEAGAQGLKERQVIPTLLPGTTFFLGKESYAPARMLLKSGLPVAIATDRNPGSCTIESMQFITGLSCLRLQMTPLEAFRGATENGAKALGLDHEIGRLQPGQIADLILWECSDVSQIVYQFENVIPRTVFCAGEPVLKPDPGSDRGSAP